MANKNTALGGTDWTDSEGITTTDLNDTFDAAAEKIKGLTTFFLNSFLYDVWDDFDSYSLGTFTTNTLWDITNTAPSGITSTSEIIASTINASGRSLKLTTTTTGTATVNGGSVAFTKTLTANKHTSCKIKYSASSLSAGGMYNRIIISVGNPTDGWTTCSTKGNMGSVTDTQWFYIVANGSGNYDVWIGAEKTEVNSLTIAAQLKIETSVNETNISRYANVEIDDVYQSGGSV